MGSLARRLEIVFGGSARPFALSVREADILADACDAFAESFRKPEPEPAAAEAVEVAESLAEMRAHLHDLKQRLRVHAGYTRRRPRA